MALCFSILIKSMNKNELINYLKEYFLNLYFIPKQNWDTYEFRHRLHQRFAVTNILYELSNNADNYELIIYNYIFKKKIEYENIDDSTPFGEELLDLCDVCIDIAEDIGAELEFPKE